LESANPFLFFLFFSFFLFFQVLLRFSNWSSLLKPLKLHPVRPDDDEDVEGNNEAKEAGVDNVIVTVDQVHDDLDEVDHKADDGQHKIGHHQTGLRLPSTVDEHGGNDNIADAEDEKDRHHCRRPCQNSGGNRLSVARKSKVCQGILLVLVEVGEVLILPREVELAKGTASCRCSKSREGEGNG